MVTKLQDAYIIGQENFDAWSQGYNANGYLKVLPHPNKKIAFKDPFLDWQKGKPGNYYSSWGPDKVLNATITMDDLKQTKIDGFGILKSGDGKIPWLNNEETEFEFLKGYNGTIPGPMLITEPGDTIRIRLKNNLKTSQQVSNFHSHGLHVSPLGHGDNVLTSIAPGETWTVDIKIPDDHFIGLDWYHPHLHGLVNVQVGMGLGGLLAINAPYNLPDLDKFNPTTSPMYTMAIDTFGIQEIDRKGKPNDPLNQSPTQVVPAGTPLKVLQVKANGDKVYTLSDAPYNGYNAKPIPYDPAFPTGKPPALFPYGGGPLAEPVENVIHTVNGQYNPTLDIKTGEWDLFSFANMTNNPFHVIQLVKKQGNKLIPQEVTLVSIDGDASGVVEGKRREVTQLPLLNPGSRVSVQHWFEDPGTYYFLSNGTEEIMGKNAPDFIKGKKGFEDGHLIWGPQVLATVEVTGDEIPTGPFPEVFNFLKKQSLKIDALIKSANQGNFERERTFVWSANIGGAILEGNVPNDTVVSTFEGTYRINGEYFSTEPGKSMVPLAMPMLDTTEVWDIKNISGKSNPNFPVDIPLLEWHPFHIHQNDFVVLEINGIPTKKIKQSYLAGVLNDTISLPPTYAPGSVTKNNPYGTPQIDGDISNVKIAMNFEDYPGSYVNHCHILFHEDAGMMAAVRVILNTEETWLGTANKKGDAKGTKIELLQASDSSARLNLNPYGKKFTLGVDVGIADVNYKKPFNNNNVTDNITDVVTVQTSLNSPKEKFTVKVFDGKTLFDRQKQGVTDLNGTNKSILIKEFNPFKQINQKSPELKASVATGDINGDGFADIAVGLGGGMSPLIEIYSGKNFKLISRIAPFQIHADGNFQGNINLAVGDVDGDNFADVIVGQGAGGEGSVELYSGELIQKKVTLNGQQTAKRTEMISEHFHPYGHDYTGEVDVTSGYILQRPNVPNGLPVQTNNANITTLALDKVPQGNVALKVFTFLGGEHSHMDDDSGMDDHSHDDPTAVMPEDIRLETKFAPNKPLEDLSGTFADLPETPRGEPVLFARDKKGNAEFIHLEDENVPDYMSVDSSASDDKLIASGGDRLFGKAGKDIIDDAKGTGHNHLYGGKDDDIITLGKKDHAYGGQGDDLLIVGFGGKNTVTGGEGADQFWVVNERLPKASNTITDLQLDNDVIGISGYGKSPKISFGEDSQGNGTLSLEGKLIATFLDISQSELEKANLVFN